MTVTAGDALQPLCEAVGRDPGDSEALIGLARALHEQGEDQAALRIATQLVAVEPLDPGAWTIYGALLAGLGRFTDAREALERALQISPKMPAAHWNLAGVLLTLGHSSGWDHYRWGRCNGYRPHRHPDPEWAGETISGRSLVLWCEQGYGDTIQMLRYIPWVRERSWADRVILEVQPGLGPLCTGLEGVDLVVERSGDRGIPSGDHHCSLMSLPGVFEGNFPSGPYIRPSGRVSLPPAAGVRAGLVWRGASAHANDHNRSIPAEHLHPLAHVPVTWFSLQVGHEEIIADLDLVPWVIDLGSDIKDWSQTAAIIAELDLVVTCDTGVAHLAGAMGKPVWILLPNVPDWRWGLCSARSRWYPSARLLRQFPAGDWQGLIQRVVDDLNGDLWAIQ